MQIVLTIVIVVGLVLVLGVEYGGKRLVSLLENSNITVGTPTDVAIDVGKLANEYVAVRAQIALTGTQEDVDAFDAKYAPYVFKTANTNSK